ncbi:MAG: hypothetical protein LC778_10290 [Acidobacteria bacterium]|nr:hypothetical protein [Acidobacteriota bacterium]
MPDDDTGQPAPPTPPTEPPEQPPPNQQPPDNAPSDIDTVRAENAQLQETIRTLTADRNNQKTLLEQLAAVLDPNKQPKPEELAQKLTAQSETLRQRTVELAVMRLGPDSASILLNWMPFRDSIKDLDPNASDFETKIKDAIKKHKDALPKPVTPTNSGGADFQGGGGNGQKKQLTREDLKRMQPADIVKARKDGLLNNLMGVSS